MQVFQEINALLSNQNPFVCYVKPNENVWNLLVQQSDEIIDFIDQTGFVFMPFYEGKQVVIPFEGNKFSQGNLEKLEQKSAESFTSESNQKEAFENLVSKGVSSIQQGEFDKVVLSRKIVLKEQISIVDTFQNLISTYPTAFRYLFFHPKIGLWMGATPEQLVKINQNQFETVALAGTQLYSEIVIWATKEIEEQQFVTDYIVTKVKDKVNNLIVSDAKTVKAGNLAHLKSFISGELTPDFQANDLIKALHPTPAVCGLPKEKAIDFILKNEGYNRKYYAGFLGEYNKDNQTDLFVNLRCLEVENDVVHIYVGCGITKDSNPEKEFIETENKSMTMRNILVSK
ncbi:isochorismate synthase [Flavobacterium proteolyticum]|uniref:isochorismate synthase n=1 Tax=Flavobacterium proteolyticum TaxID=2911683 RepID=A0ABR9WS57_9FLAO|nr:isochorismate synthase [Flavobacterium proteolyticum]MBE9576751.1 isochorismate synthase [Flavobacterium proteolyticum]